MKLHKLLLRNKGVNQNYCLLAGESNPALPRSGDGGFRQWQAGVSVCLNIYTDRYTSQEDLCWQLADVAETERGSGQMFISTSNQMMLWTAICRQFKTEESGTLRFPVWYVFIDGMGYFYCCTNSAFDCFIWQCLSRKP
jgi:hypothetical protein